MNHHRKKWRAARIVTSVLLVLSFFWAWLFALTFWNRIYVLRHRGGFSKAEFVVASVEYYRGSKSGPAYWANGEVQGVTERMALGDVLDKPPASREELEARVPPGTVFTVLHNPAFTRSIVQGETPRVMLYMEGFWEKQKALAYRLGAYMFLPIWIALLAKIGISVLARQRDRSVDETRHSLAFEGHMDPQLPFPLEKTLLKAPSSSFRALALERVAPKLAEIRPTPAAHRMFGFMKATVYAAPLMLIGLFVFIKIQARQADPDGVLSSPWLWLLPVMILAGALIGAPLFLRFVRRALLPEPTRIDLANGILTLPASMTGSLAALLGGASGTPNEVRMSDVAALQICAGMSEGESSYKVFQLNLVLSSPAGERLPLISHGKEADLREDARSLAKLLSVPLLDHSAEETKPKKGKAFWKTGQ